MVKEVPPYVQPCLEEYYAALVKRIIMINSLKGGVGKTSIAFCIIRHLIHLKKRIKVFDFDSINNGLTTKIENFLTTEERSYLDVEQIFHEDFFRHSIKIIQSIYIDFDYIILDGHIFPREYMRVKKMLPNLLCLVYIIPDDDCLNEDNLRLAVRQYTGGVQNKLVFLYNSKNDQPERLSHYKTIVVDEMEKTCVAENLSAQRKPKEARKAIGYHKDISALYKNYSLVTKLLLDNFQTRTHKYSQQKLDGEDYWDNS